MAEQKIEITASQLAEAFKAAVQELKRPDPETELRLAEEKARKIENQKASAREQEQIKQMEESQQQFCSHMKGAPYTGQHRIVGQVHSDGLFHPMCFACRKVFQPFPPGPDTIPGNETLGSDTMKFISPKMIEQFGKRYAEQQAVK